jgi:PAP2 superfamily protein
MARYRRWGRRAEAVLLAAVLLGGCGSDIPELESLGAANTSSDDPGAGNWRMVVLTGPTQFTVPAPEPAGSASYTAELATIKTAQGSITDAQREAIDYWSAGGVLRWNQILRELVARYNLPPAPRDNGTYVFPDANNPFADPAFPFANPPYAARAYSYVAVAQYDALKSAWYWKYQFNRRSPSKNDSGVQALMPTTDLPSYPSDDAVLSGVSTEVLRLMFPAAIEEITRKAGEQREAALLSGKASPSDIAAGLALGRAVAAVFVTRASTDGMGAAVGTPAQWQALADAATARGEIPWKSLEIPPRPPMLPNFGKVKAWMMTPTDILNERLPAPPSTSSAQMQQEVAEVRETVANLDRDQQAIAYKWNDGAGTVTPPGHWNAIAVEHISAAGWSPVRASRALALVNMTLHDAAVGCWDTKYAYFNPRPSQMDSSIKTMIGLPNFPSYSSGHSTFSAAAAVVLSYLFPGNTATFDAMRDEAGISRLYGGIHYRSDIENGKEHGSRIAGYTLAFAQEDGAN